MRNTFSEDFKKQLIGSGLDPNLEHPTGGVGATCSCGDSLFELKPVDEGFRRQCQLSRTLCCGYGKGKGSKLVIFYIVHGYPGGHGSSFKANAMCSIIQVIADDVSLRPNGAVFIIGDLNADAPDLPRVQKLIQDEGWTDLGAIADQWGQPKEQHTCITKTSNQPTRTDYILASPMGVQLVSHFQVTPHDVCPTRSTITFHLNTGDASYYMYRARVIWCLADMLEAGFRQQYGFALDCDTNIEYFESSWAAANPGNAIATPHFEKLIQGDKAAVENGVKLHHARYFNSFHSYLDYILDAKKQDFTSLLNTGNTSAYWELLWTIIEQALLVSVARSMIAARGDSVVGDEVSLPSSCRRCYSAEISMAASPAFPPDGFQRSPHKQTDASTSLRAYLSFKEAKSALLGLLLCKWISKVSARPS